MQRRYFLKSVLFDYQKSGAELLEMIKNSTEKIIFVTPPQEYAIRVASSHEEWASYAIEAAKQDARGSIGVIQGKICFGAGWISRQGPAPTFDLYVPAP